MAQEYYRFRIDLAIPRSVWESLTQTQRDAWRDKIAQLRMLAKKINVGLFNEEDTVRAKVHICRHEFGETCPIEGDI